MTAAVKKTIKAAEVANHTTAEDCWLIIHGKVYDATTFLNDHPGGAGVLLEVAGKDSSDEFDAVGHTDAAMELLERYYIGDLEVRFAKARPFFAPPSLALLPRSSSLCASRPPHHIRSTPTPPWSRRGPSRPVA